MIQHVLLERSLKKSAKPGRINDLTMSNYTLERACLRAKLRPDGFQVDYSTNTGMIR
jgi:hypothetical protein